ncbi:MAG: hypothetical protein C4583_19065 [Anaerolineaceae bacterium]|nr:MAG: hypothetical protein C4583_19065 [Anaerolineaceae bacterium]
MTSPSPLLFNNYYHIYVRGTNRENIFVQERNYTHFMNLYWKYIEPITDTFAYCLLRNHAHIMVRTKSQEEILENKKILVKTLKVSLPNPGYDKQDSPANRGENLQRKPLGSDYISRQFSNFLNAYAKAINNAYSRTGSLFEHPFGRVLITSERQFWNVIAYIHKNPQKHKFVKDFRDWKYSSYGIILSEKRTSISRNEVMKWFGSKDDYLRMHEQWVEGANSHWLSEDDFD